MNIKITDERIEQVVPVALENIKAEIVEAKPQTFETLDENGEVKMATLNVIQPGQTTTLKDIDSDISDLEIRLSQAQSQAESLTAELQKKKDTRLEFETLVKSVYESLQGEIARRQLQEEPVGEILP